MILDQSTVMSDAQDITATAVSTHSIDQGGATDKPIAQELWVEFRVDTAFGSAGGSETLTIGIITATTNAGLTTSSTPLVTTGAIPQASLVAGAVYRMRVPIKDTLRFLGILYTVSSAMNAGKIDAYVIATPYQR
jgi:hypothetical protein